jgi:RHS repeat-associated protein
MFENLLFHKHDEIPGGYMPKVNCVPGSTPVPLSSFFSLARLGCFVLIASGCLSYFSRPMEAQIDAIHSEDVPNAPAQVELPPPPPMRYMPGMEEPLVATGPVTERENKDLDAALSDFHDAPAKAGPAGDYDDYAKPLLGFVAAHPNSNWNAALYTDLGFGYYRAGYYSRTFTYLEKAWQLGRNATTPQAHLMVDRAVGELARMHARVGHDEELEALFADIGKRPITGPATELIQGAHEGLAYFHSNPGISYLCGPAALRNVLVAMKGSLEQIKIADDARSGPHGFSLQELAVLADKTKLNYQLIHREAGQPIPVPSIINWNVHHYAAVISSQNEHYLVQDPTFGGFGGLLTTEKAIDAESSGYFLVPRTVIAVNPKSGWRMVSADSGEAKTVYGMGTVYGDLPGATMTADKKICPQCPGQQNSGKTSQNDSSNTIAPEPMATASAHIVSVNLNLTDTPVGYRPQKGGSALTTLTYNAREAEQPANFSFSNVSPKWTYSWLAYISDDPNNPGSSVTRIASGGGGYDYSLINPPIYNSTTGAFTPETYDNSQLFRYPPSGPATSYVRYMPDGSEEVYALSNGATTAPRFMFLTQVIDPAGNITALKYDKQFRLTSVTDAMGRKTTFQYGVSNAPLLITKISDPFGRHSQLTYDTSGRLSSITDPIGITSSFTYGSTTEPNFITQLTTPYGASTFSDIPNPNDPQPYFARSLALTDPLGYVDLLYFYQDQAVTGTPSSEAVVPNGMSDDNSILQWRNTYYWDRHAAANGGVTTDGNGNPIAETWANPTIYHWLHFCCQLVYASNQLGSIKKPLEQYRQWFNYPGMANSGYYYWSGSLIKPSSIGRVLDDGTTQLTQATYNGFGLPLTNIDPNGRATQFSYATNNIDLLTVQQLTAPSTYTTIATFGNYNTQHEPQAYTGADGQTWNYTYNTAGQLSSVTDPNSGLTSYNYDSLSRLSTIVDANRKIVLTLTYDSADRVHTREDSQGYILTYDYDAIDRVTMITYPDGTTDLYNYNFLSGTNAGKPSLDLRKHTDRLGRVTTYGYDADRRLTSVTEPVEQGKKRTTQYAYYENGTLQSITDANGNVTKWDIDLQSRPIAKQYQDGTGETTTYESTTSRIKSVIDAAAQVKSSAYAPDDRVTGINYENAINPTPNVTFAYDPYFPRLLSMTDGTGTTNYGYTAIGTNGALQVASVAGPYQNDTSSFTYDPLARLATRSIPGGNESFGYDAISRLISHTTPLGTFNYGYLGETGQTTSRSVTNGSTNISTAWKYDTNTNDRRLISIANSGVTRSYKLGYSDGTTVNPYDIMSIADKAAAGHPFSSEQRAYTYDEVDRVLSATATKLGNYSYVYDPLDNAKEITEPHGTVRASYNEVNEIALWNENDYQYDGNGNTLSGDGKRTYKWDAENRLVEIDYAHSSANSQFSYDGVGHRIIDVETAASGGTTTTRYLWCGDRVCQTRDSSDNVFKRDLDEGEFNVMTGQQLVYITDQLGSIRDVLDGTTGGLVAATDYTPYGATSRSYGATATDYQYAALFIHPPSGLNFGTYRAQDGITTRFINRDPIRENGGINLYAYVGSSPVGYLDPDALDKITICLRQGTLSLTDDNGNTVFTSSAYPGCSSTPTNPGHYKAGRWQANKTSNAYPNTQTPYSNPYWGWTSGYGPWFLPINTETGTYTGTGIHGTSFFEHIPWISCSHGCVRLSNDNIQHLHSLLPNPSGTPIDIIADCDQ